MKKNLWRLFALVVAAAMAMPVMAQDGGQKVKEINFEDDVIEGELQLPNQLGTTALGDSDLISLIRVREDFMDEMIKSVEDL